MRTEHKTGKRKREKERETGKRQWRGETKQEAEEGKLKDGNETEPWEGGREGGKGGRRIRWERSEKGDTKS